MGDVQRSWNQLNIERCSPQPDSPWLQRFHQWWLTKRRDGIPSRSDIDPMIECDARLLPHLSLLDVLESPIDFRYRVVGTAIVAVEGQDNTGKRLGECGLDGDDGVLRAVYEKVAKEKEPLGYVGTVLWRGTDPLAVEALHLPLTKRGEKADMILGATLFRYLRDGRLVQWADR